ncbi:MAG: leucine-rich repeat domain-containing protein, partial [Oscillospiraceae bacterium]
TATAPSTVDAFSIAIEISAKGDWNDTDYPYFGDVSFLVIGKVATPDPEPTTYTLPYTKGEGTGVDLADGDMVFEKATVAEGGIVYITLDAYVSNAIKLMKADGSEALAEEAAPISPAVCVGFKLSADAAAEITANGFALAGDAGVVNAVAYAEPENESVNGLQFCMVGSEDYTTEQFAGVTQAKFTFNVTAVDPTKAGTLMFATNSDIPDSDNDNWVGVPYSTYPIHATNTYYYKLVENTGIIEVTVPMDMSNVGEWFNASVKTTNKDAVTGTLIKIEFLDKDENVVVTYDPNAPAISKDNFTFSTLTNTEMKVGDSFTIKYDSTNTPESAKYRIKYKIYAPNDPSAWENHIYPEVVKDDGSIDDSLESKTGLKVTSSVDGNETTYTFTATAPSTVDAFSIAIEISAKGDWSDTDYPWFGDVSYLVVGDDKPEPGKETVLFEGSTNMGTNWDVSETIPKFAAKKGGKITATFTEGSAKDGDGNLYWQIAFKDSSWDAFPSSKPNQWGSVELSAGATSYSFTLDATDAASITSGGMIIAGYNVTVTKITYTAPAEGPVEETVDINSTNFPNSTFRTYVNTLDKDGDKKLSASEIAAVTEIDVSGKNINNFKGIEYFTALTTLNISGNTGITALDVSANEALATLNASGCTKLASVVLPTGIVSLNVSKTAIKTLDVSAYTALEDLDVSDTSLTALVLTSNTALKTLNVSNVKFAEGLDVSANTNLTSLKAANCGLTAIDVSANTALETLDVSNNSLVALNLTGLDSLTTLTATGNTRNIGTVSYEDGYDLTALTDDGLVIEKIGEVTGATKSDNDLVNFEGKTVTYEYDTGLEGKTVTFTLTTDRVIKVNYIVNDGDDNDVKCETWTEVLAAIKDKTKDYTVYVYSDVTVEKLTFPSASKAKSVTVKSGTEDAKTITTDSASVSLPVDVVFMNIKIESTASKGLTISASKDLGVSNFTSKSLTTLKGGSKSVLKVVGEFTVNYAISGFGTVDIYGNVEFANTVKATKLVLEDYSAIIVGDKAVTFTNIEAGEGTIIAYGTKDFVPVTVTGSVTAEEPITIGVALLAGFKFAKGQTVLTAKTADLSKFELHTGSLPESELGFTLARDGSDVKVMEAAFKVTNPSNREEVATFALWSDVLNTIAENAKNGNKDKSYDVELLADVNIGGPLTMPKAGTFGLLYINSANAKTLTFTGTNISITGRTAFMNLILKSEKTVRGEKTYVDFSFNAGKNQLGLAGVTGKIKDIKSSGKVILSGTTINGTVSANDLYINDGTEPTEQTNTGAIPATNSFTGTTPAKTSVTIQNLNVKNMLALEGSLTVKGAFSAAGITSEVSSSNIALVLYRNTKKPAAIGKLGFDSESDHIKFALVDPTTGKTVQIVNDTVIASISGPYADQLVPCDENLAEDESYYIVKENGKLVAKSTDTSFVEVIVNGNTARYASLDDAIKDINATGSKDDKVEFKITQAMFSEPIAKLPLPNAGKYGELYYTADENVTIKVTSDLALTGDLYVAEKITINKVDKSGNVVPMSVNVGKYTMLAGGYLSAKTEVSSADAQPAVNAVVPVSQIANISGSGSFATGRDAVVTGKVNVGCVQFVGNTITLEGTKSSFTASVFVHPNGSGSTLAYDKANAKNVKFGDISGDEALTVKIDGVKAGDAIASITGDYTAEMIEIDGSSLVVARSDKNLVAISIASVIPVIEYDNNKTRLYDTLENAMKDINRLNNKNGYYRVGVNSVSGKTYSKLPLPAAGKYEAIEFIGNGSNVINVTSDITLTGGLWVDIGSINKVDKNGKVVEMSVNVG